MVLICHQQDRQTEAVLAIEQALDRGELSMDDLMASTDRIHALKKPHLSTFQPVDPSQVSQTVGIPPHKSFLGKIHRVAARV